MNEEHVTNGVLQIWKSKSKESVLKTTGYSMRPMIDHGDDIVLRHVDVEEVRRGDLVTFKVASTVVTHRVIRRINRGGAVWFLQKGDFGPRAFRVPAECAVGKVVEIRSGASVISLRSWFARAAGYVVALLETLLGGPIQFLSKRLKDQDGQPKRLNLFLYRVFLRLRSMTIDALLHSIRFFCKTGARR